MTLQPLYVSPLPQEISARIQSRQTELLSMKAFKSVSGREMRAASPLKVKVSFIWLDFWAFPALWGAWKVSMFNLMCWKETTKSQKATELTSLTIRPGTDLFTWTTTGNSPVILLYTRPHVAPAIQAKYACYAPLAFTENAANFILCVCPAFSYVTTLNAIAKNCAISRLTCWKTRASGWGHRM